MKGLIVDIKDDCAIVLKDDGMFVNIKNKKYTIGQRVRANGKSFINTLKIVACIALCLISSTFAYKFYYTPYSYLYIDINPSVRLDLNYFDMVIDCTPLNDDAKFIEISSGNVEDSINQVIIKCEEEGFLTEENNEIEINVSKSREKVRKSISKVEDKYKSTKYNLVVKNTNDEECRKANVHGISVKRQRLIEEFSVVFGGDESGNAEKLQNKTTKEIDAIIANKQMEDSTIEKSHEIETATIKERKVENKQEQKPAINEEKKKPNNEKIEKVEPPEKDADKGDFKKPKEDFPVIKEVEPKPAPEDENKMTESPKTESMIASEDQEKTDRPSQAYDDVNDKTDEKSRDIHGQDDVDNGDRSMGENVKERPEESAYPSKDKNEEAPSAQKEPIKQDGNNAQNRPPKKDEKVPMDSNMPSKVREKDPLR
ncbi:MAG: hypothetical protein IKU84_01875 [Clostridia bacterium]|nr:hypothetical protein [Clostridia bacterium]